MSDSRKAEAGTLFVPIVGERVDAHKFIPQVMEAGALATLSERVLDNADFPYIAVESSLQAVKDIAEFYREQLTIPIVGITGSVGKTKIGRPDPCFRHPRPAVLLEIIGPCSEVSDFSPHL